VLRADSDPSNPEYGRVAFHLRGGAGAAAAAEAAGATRCARPRPR
jgi:hypothetical protein